MGYENYADRYQMHTLVDKSLYFREQQYAETHERKYFVIQERDISYRATAHFHPFADRLTRRFLETGVRGLEAADTEYASDGSALPESVVVSVPTAAVLTVPAGSGFSLAIDTVVHVTGGTDVTVSAGTHLHVSGVTLARVARPTTNTLVVGLTPAPEVGQQITPGAVKAFLSEDSPAAFAAATSITLFNGAPASVDAGTAIRIDRGTECTLPASGSATVVASVRRPAWFSDLLTQYGPTSLVSRPRPVRDLDFTSGGAYSGYNWELFFHVPMAMGIQLSKSQQYAEAQRWMHYVFDPTDDSDGPTPERFWKVRPFQTTDVKSVEDLLVNLATGADPNLREETANSIDAWQRAPFRPFVIARFRQQAFMYRVVMAYLDNLIEWGDSLFRQDTGEAIDEALNLYMLAASILGPRPQVVPAKGTVRPQTYDNLRKDLHKLGTVLRTVEAEVPYDLMPLPSSSEAMNPQAAMVRSLGKALYFCVPPNDRLLRYWDTVADRLFKIHNSLNLSGTFRQLALFDPPIDPAMLARATAAGIDVASVVNGINQPLPLVRYAALSQRALEIAQEVKSLGGQLLAAMEKEDAESLALLRSRHEGAMLSLVEQVKYGQVQEAKRAREGLTQTLRSGLQRYAFFEKQMGRSDSDLAAIDAAVALDDESLDGIIKLDLTTGEPELALHGIKVDVFATPMAQAASESGAVHVSPFEAVEAALLESGQIASDVANVVSLASSISHFIPNFGVHVQPWGFGGTAQYGGNNVGQAMGMVASGARAISERLNFEARRAARIDGLIRRERDWTYQSNLAALEIMQTVKQIRAAQIRVAVAELELRNHRVQMQQAKEIQQFLNADGADPHGKATNQALYSWLKREVRGLYSQAFQLAFEVAKKAERALQHELGDPSASFIRYDYLNGKQALLAGEKLALDIKRMEMAYAEMNRREYELTKHVSLLQLDPRALVELRTTGRCTVSLPESVFTFDGPSHYFRRIRSIALSLPSAAGPFTSVNCTLTLLRSSIRKSPLVGDRPFAREGAEDDRFSDYLGSTQSIVTSAALNDAGLFEPDAHDERYLPLEYAGVICDLSLQLPANPSAGEPMQFDYDTIRDVILHVRYTAREGGKQLHAAAMADLQTKIAAAEALGSSRLLSLRDDFPDAWAAYLASTAVGDFRPLTITITPQHFPIWSSAIQDGATITSTSLIVRSTSPVKVADPAGSAGTTDNLGAFVGDLLEANLDKAPKPVIGTPWQVAISHAGGAVSDAWLLIEWGAAP